MRFDSLNIPAFGPFTDFKLEFPHDGTDLHLIYGQNEAGKSSLLRGLKGLLFGIPARSKDNFTHDYGKLLLGAHITHDKQTHQFFRKKGNKNTLIDASSNTIPDTTLQRILGPINEDFFDHMFGLSTDKLRSGAESLLSGNNEIGTLLFSASLGGTRIDKAIEKLETEANSLAKGGARTNVRIPTAIARFKELEKLSKDASTSTTQWKAIEKSYDQAASELDRAKSELANLHHRQATIQRILTALPQISRRAEMLARLREINLPELASDFQERVRRAQSELSEALAVIKPAQQALESKSATRAALPDHAAILEASPSLEALHQSIQQHMKDLRELKHAELQLSQYEEQLSHELTQLGYFSELEFSKETQPTRAELAHLNELANHLKESLQALTTAKESAQKIDHDIDDKSNDLASLESEEFPPEHEALLERAQAEETELKSLKPLRTNLETDRISLQHLGNQLLPSADPDSLRALIPPTLARIESLIRQHNEIQTTLTEHQNDQRKVENEIAEIESELEHFKKIHGAIVTKDDLITARKVRDADWITIRSQLQSNQSIAPDHLETFQGYIAQPDQISDQLLDDADATARAASRRDDLDKKHAKLQQIQQDISRIETQLAAWNSDWISQTNFLKNHSFDPVEMLTWLGHWAEWNTLDLKIRSTESTLKAADAEHLTLLQQLRDALNLPTSDLTSLRSHLQHAKNLAAKSQGKKSILEQDLARLRSEQKLAAHQLNVSTEQHSAAVTNWQHAIARFQLTSPPTQAIAQLESRLALAQQIETKKATTTTRDQLQSQVTDFQSRLHQATATHLPHLAEKPDDEQESALWLTLTTARDHKAQSQALTADIENRKEEIAKQTAIRDRATTALNDLISAAQLDSQEQLEAAIHDHQERLKLTSDLAIIKQDLLTAADGLPLEEFIQQCQQADPATLKDEVADIVSKLELAQHQRDTLHEAFLNLKNQKETIELASSNAIDAKQDAENALAEIITDTERFIRLHHAIDFLRAQIEAYRENAQGPLIRKTSHYFSKLTCHEFSGVAARPADDGSIQLVALRPATDTTLPATELTTDALSEGTRDQLYLALRLAAIDKHLETHPPMPLILDDVLMTFDDQRTHALLETLVEFSHKTQILIFTHHPHNLTLAKSANIPHHPHTISA